MSTRLFVGLDTSNYTTSAALCDETGAVLCNEKMPLPVADGERGLRQSDAVFSHVRALPQAAAALRAALGDADRTRIVAIGVSGAPRDADGSYMPCFLAGVAAAETAGALLGVPVYRFSHQDGHLMAALHSAGEAQLLGRSFAAFHVSGGTTDVMLVRPDTEHVFAVEKIGGTCDINAGQAIDRVGVRMGLHFPAGAALEQLALQNRTKLPPIRISVKDTFCNLSGLENKAVELYESTGDAPLTAAYTLSFIGSTLRAMRDAVRLRFPELPLLFAGGVMSCSILKRMLAEENVFFAEAKFSSDNAAGTALLARYRLLHPEGE